MCLCLAEIATTTTTIFSLVKFSKLLLAGHAQYEDHLLEKMSKVFQENTFYIWVQEGHEPLPPLGRKQTVDPLDQ